MHETSLLLPLFIAFAAGKLAAELAERLRQPAVVGELLVGIALGPSALGWLDPAHSPALEVVAELGVLVLLFQVGLHTDPADLRAVGGVASGVAAIGVVAPFAAGYGVALASGADARSSAFVATALVATSVAVTARVLAARGQLETTEARIILGAAVIDDVLGLMVLAVVDGLARGSLDTSDFVVLFIEAIILIGGVLVVGPPLLNRLSPLLEAPRIPRAPFVIAIALLLGLSVAAERIGLAAIVGAFLAGSVLSGTRDRAAIQRDIEPLADILGPIFFVATGALVDVGAFLDPGTIVLATVLSVVAIAGKLLAGLPAGRGRALLVGTGMVPRGEVGIIVAGIALASGVLTPELFGAVMATVVVTTLVAPPVLDRLLAKR